MVKWRGLMNYDVTQALLLIEKTTRRIEVARARG